MVINIYNLNYIWDDNKNMIEIKIVVKCHKHLNDSDREYILNFFNNYFKESKEIEDIYIQERSVWKNVILVIYSHTKEIFLSVNHVV